MGNKTKLKVLISIILIYIVLLGINLTPALSSNTNNIVELSNLIYNTKYCFSDQVNIKEISLQNKQNGSYYYVLGLMNYYGINTAVDKKKALIYLLKSAKSYNADAMFVYAMLLSANKNFQNQNVLYWLKQASRYGNLYATTNLSVILDPDDIDYETFQNDLLNNAKSFGYAQYILGSQLVQSGRKSDFAKGKDLLIKAYENNNSPIIIKYKSAYMISLIDNKQSVNWQKNSANILIEKKCDRKDKKLQSILYLG